jgi:3-oxoacyl-[acyl-carrier protein] reductase
LVLICTSAGERRGTRARRTREVTTLARHPRIRTLDPRTREENRAEGMDGADIAAASAASAKPLEGRVAIVTGASRGIGRAIASHLSALGASLVLGYASSAAEAESLAAELPRAVAVRADVSDESAVRSLFDAAERAFGAARIVVANAGVLDAAYPSVAGTATASFDRTVAVNRRGAFLCVREAASRLPRGGGGRIVAVTSSVVGSHPTGYAAYTASKAAVEALVRTLAKELKGTRVTANCVAPGATASDMFFAGKSEETVRMIAETNPMERLGQPGDIAPVVGFLCTDAAEWVNGQVIRANGGYV